jgi:NAD(P)-dependent dehydrogenase (short-subunit alcohol dehydrogenase family)
MQVRSMKVAVITGASAGIGRATVREFGHRGAHIGLLARGLDGLEAAKREVEALGGRALAIPTDVADLDQVKCAAEQIEAELGPIDIWVNNAFAGIFAKFMDTTPEEYKRVTDVTYFGQVHGTRAALKRMLPRDHGVIVLVGSALAYRGIPLQSAYCGAKHALQGFQDSVKPTTGAISMAPLWWGIIITAKSLSGSPDSSAIIFEGVSFLPQRYRESTTRIGKKWKVGTPEPSRSRGTHEIVITIRFDRHTPLTFPRHQAASQGE